MEKKYCKWKDEEIKALFFFVQGQTANGVSLTKAFSRYAAKSQRKPNSVRNYYYAELANLETNPERSKELGIDLSKHKKTSPNYFSKEEASTIVLKINDLVKKGNSVRKACLLLSGGNVEEMVRLQNKYRTLSKKSAEKTASKTFGTNSNIILMPQKPKHLTDAEINSLFLGVLKLIKNSVKQEMQADALKQAQSANMQLRKTLTELAGKEASLRKLKKQFELLKQENTEQTEKLKIYRSTQPNIESNQNNKMTALKRFTAKTQKQKPEEQTN